MERCLHPGCEIMPMICWIGDKVVHVCMYHREEFSICKVCNRYHPHLTEQGLCPICQNASNVWNFNSGLLFS